SPVGISEIKNNVVQVYPNPASSYISLTKNIDEIFITDVEGRVVMESLKLNAGDKISVSQLKDGLYFINAHYNNESTKFKFVKCSTH
ncbi:MAG TPA: T9SS type A sorting domain-containing protein, partial [Bacteroidia bacterium]|nr:T9SS type A sorting domain-containing protein [Bacteroidia bacterium]